MPTESGHPAMQSPEGYEVKSETRYRGQKVVFDDPERMHA